MNSNNKSIEYLVKKGEGYGKIVAEILSLNFESKKKVILLSGDLGAGKTSFTIDFLKLLVGEEEFKKMDVMSPTFSIVNEYKSKSIRAIHADFYRVTPETYDIEEIFEEIETADYSFIEWHEKLPKLKENLSEYIEISIKKLAGDDRKVVSTLNAL